MLSGWIVPFLDAGIIWQYSTNLENPHITQDDPYLSAFIDFPILLYFVILIAVGFLTRHLVAQDLLQKTFLAFPRLKLDCRLVTLFPQ
jgi:hypothetical protein